MDRQVVSSVFFIIALALSSSTFAETELAAQLEAAQASFAEAKAAGHAWRANRLALEAAERALTAGDEAEARARIDEAMQLAEASLAQAATEAETWQTRMPFFKP